MLLGLVYPLVVTGVGQVAFNDKANGSLIERDGAVVGSELLGQHFTDAEYFWPRPSAAGDAATTASSSGGSQPRARPTPTSSTTVAERVGGLPRGQRPARRRPRCPSTPSPPRARASTPHISVANARLQAARVAEARELPTSTTCSALVDDAHHRTGRSGSSASAGVNVLELNLALDARDGVTGDGCRIAAVGDGARPLRIYLGAAPGVGKTYAMLDEGWRRHERGTDVVVGYRRDPRAAEDRRPARATSRSSRARR